MNIIPANTPEWTAARIGKVTASRIADLTARTKTGWGAGRANYMAELIAEDLTKVAAEHYRSDAMQRGSDKEIDARAAYEFRTDAVVTDGGFVLHPKIMRAGASPDAFIGDDGLLEIKCPNTATHIDTLLGGSISGAYVKQMQWQMACTGRKWCDHVSFDDRLPESMRLHIERVVRDDVIIAELEGHVTEFLVEMNRKLLELSARYEARKAA